MDDVLAIFEEIDALRDIH